MMAQRHPIYRPCTMIGQVWLPSLLCAGNKLSPRRLGWGRACFCIGSSPTFPFTGSGPSRCTLALINIWCTTLFTRQSTPLSILTIAMPMSYVHYMTVGVLPQTPFTLYSGSYQSPYRTYTSLVVIWSARRFTMRLSAALRPSVTEIRESEGNLVFMQLLVYHI